MNRLTRYSFVVSGLVAHIPDVVSIKCNDDGVWCDWDEVSALVEHLQERIDELTVELANAEHIARRGADRPAQRPPSARYGRPPHVPRIDPEMEQAREHERQQREGMFRVHPSKVWWGS